ncbi:aspartate/glutamate racemase family protein [Actinomycetospora sp. C-140]
MRLQVVNPNTTASMTATIGAAARSVAAPGTEIVAVTSPHGPVSIESHHDEAMAVPGLLAALDPSADAHVIACFGDPGLDAAREVARGPVVGIAEAAMRTALYLGRAFSVVTTLARTAGRAEELAQRYGAAHACRRVRACEVPVLGLEDPAARAAILRECRAAVELDGADVIVLGCAGMADLCAALTAELGVPVLDGVAAATRAAESLVALGVTTSRRSEYAPPPPK